VVTLVTQMTRVTFSGRGAGYTANTFNRLAEDHEQVARAGLLEQLVAHGQGGVHLGGQDGEHPIAFDPFRDVRVEGEAAHHQQIEADPLHRLLGRFLDLRWAYRAVLRADR
jgi:hypothetical protein